MTGNSVSFQNDKPYKVVGLIASIMAILACVIGAVTWASINMANNALAIKSLRQDHTRYEVLITKNAEVLAQHAELIGIITWQGDQLKVLNRFMTEGGRFTERDGAKLQDEMRDIKDRLQHYEVLETELSWIKKSISRMEVDIARRFDGLHKKLDVKRVNP
jgi:hypothetical protein